MVPDPTGESFAIGGDRDRATRYKWKRMSKVGLFAASGTGGLMVGRWGICQS